MMAALVRRSYTHNDVNVMYTSNPLVLAFEEYLSTLRSVK